MIADSTADEFRRAGVLLVGHGTRSQPGRDQFFLLAEQVRKRLLLPLEPAFLELAEPTIEQAVERLVASGIDRLVIAPLLLFAAGHAKRDVPAKVTAALSHCGAGALPICPASHFGCHPLIVELACRRLAEAIEQKPPVSAENTLLVAVGRGSTDPSATAEMHEFARRLAVLAGIPRVAVGFLAMAQPPIGDVLLEVDEKVIRRVVVQPHLLLDGELVEKLREEVHEIAVRRPHQEWIVTGVLADDSKRSGAATDLLATATVDLIQRELRE